MGQCDEAGPGPGPEAGWGQGARPFIIRMEGGGEAKGGRNTAVGEGSMQRASDTHTAYVRCDILYAYYEMTAA